MNIAAHIDHTILKTDCTAEAIKQLCEVAVTHQFAAVCVPPYFVGQAARQLEKETVKVATVAGFPMGFATTAAKVEEIKRAIEDGADEIDVVINILAVKDKNWNHVDSDLDSCVSAVHLRGKVIKVILETALLTEAEIIKLCEICTEKKVNYVKTSTGMNDGATPEMVRLLKQHLPEKIKIKASGGIRNREQAIKLIEAGATRLGTSAGTDLL